MTRRDKGLMVRVGSWVGGGVAVLGLLAAPAMAEERKGAQAGDDVQQRLERLEQQVKENKEGIWPHLGGHFGVVFPLVTSNGSDTTTINEDFGLGFPMGITVKKPGPLAFDLELVPTINDHDVNLTVHPGVLYALGDGWTAGLRMGFDIGQNSWGPTPLINKKLFDLTEHSHLFIELPVPIRITKDQGTTVTAAVHLGIGF